MITDPGGEMRFLRRQGQAAMFAHALQSEQVFVPIRAEGNLLYDNGGDIIAQCHSAAFAARIAQLINKDSGF